MSSGPLKAGYMEKLGGFIPNWKRRYFVLENHTLSYYENETAYSGKAKPNGSIPVPGAKIALIRANVHKREHAFGVTPQGSKRTYVCVAENNVAMRAWIAALKSDGAEYTGPTDDEVEQNQPVSVFSVKEGFLVKCGGRIKSWHPRYFILDGEALHYYRNNDLASVNASIGSIRLAEGTVQLEPAQPAQPGKICFSVYCKANDRKYLMVTPDLDNAKAWIQAIQESINNATRNEIKEQSEPSTQPVATPIPAQSNNASATAAAAAAAATAAAVAANDNREPFDESFFENVWPNLGADDVRELSTGVTMGWMLRWDDRDRDEDHSRWWKRRWVVLARATRTMRCWLKKEDAHPKSGVKPLKTFLLQGAQIKAEPTLQCSRCVSAQNPHGGQVVISVAVMKSSKAKLGKPMYWAAPNPDSCNLWLKALELCAAKPQPSEESDEEDVGEKKEVAGESSSNPEASATDDQQKTEGGNVESSDGAASASVNPEDGSKLADHMSPEVAARVSDRLKALENMRAEEVAEEQEKSSKDGDVKSLMDDWTTACKKDLGLLLYTLHDIFPSAPRPDRIMVETADAADVKKAYHAAVKFVHPDKMTNPSVGEKVLASAVFEVLTNAYNAYKTERGI